MTGHLQDGVDRFLLGRVDEGAGVDDQHVGGFGIAGDARAGMVEQAHHDFAVDEVFGAAEADESDAQGFVGRGSGFNGGVVERGWRDDRRSRRRIWEQDFFHNLYFTGLARKSARRRHIGPVAAGRRRCAKLDGRRLRPEFRTRSFMNKSILLARFLTEPTIRVLAGDRYYRRGLDTSSAAMWFRSKHGRTPFKRWCAAPKAAAVANRREIRQAGFQSAECRSGDEEFCKHCVAEASPGMARYARPRGPDAGTIAGVGGKARQRTKSEDCAPDCNEGDYVSSGLNRQGRPQRPGPGMDAAGDGVAGEAGRERRVRR